MGLDLSAAYQTKIDEALKEARQKEQNGQVKDAARHYEEVARIYVDFARDTKSESIKKQRADLARSFLEKAKILYSTKSDYAGKQRIMGNDSGEQLQKSENLNNAETKELKQQIESLITKVTIDWNDIAGLNEVKNRIKSIYGIKLAKPPKNVRLDQNLNLLLYGPPGTGKTLLAGAVSNSLEATFFNANASDLVSKWLGESSRLVASLFEIARDMSPSVIFIDEFDSLVSSRENLNSQSEARILGSVLSELDGINSKISHDKLVILIAATNVPWNLDRASLSRFSGGKIYIPLPDELARHGILELNLTKKGLNSEVSIEELVGLTEGFSGREISAVCNAASQLMINRLNPELSGKIDSGLDAIRHYQLVVGPINLEEFQIALQQVSPSINSDFISKYIKWSGEE